MKLKLIAAVALLTITPLSFAGRVKMPSAQVLHERLQGFEHFVEKTSIVKQLADRELEALGVANALELSLYDYDEILKKGMPAQQARMLQVQMQMNKPILLKALLEHSPEALKELEEKNIYEPIKANK